MPTTPSELDRRSYLKTTGLATAGMIGLAGCSGNGGSTDDDSDGDDSDSETTFGTLSTAVTDQPSAIGDFESLTVTIDGIWIKPAGGSDGEESDDGEINETDDSMNETESINDSDEAEMDDEEIDDEEIDDEEGGDGGSGRRYIEFEEPQDADLVQLQGSNTKLIDETEVETGEYGFLQLDVSNTEGILTDGSEAEVTTPGNAPLKFNQSFEVRANERTRFIADFAPNKRGPNGYVIIPVAASTTVLYGDEEYDGGDGDTEDEEMDTNETTDGDSQNETTDGDSQNETTDGDSQNETTTNETN